MHKTIPILRSDMIRQDGSGRLFRYLTQAISFVGSILFAAIATVTASAGNLDSSYDVNVLVIEYFHINASGDTTFDPNIKFDPDPKIKEAQEAGGWVDYCDYYRTLPVADQKAGAGWWIDYCDYNKTLLSVADQVSAMRTAAEEGSRYLLYKYPATQFPENQRPQAALRYRIVDTLQKFEKVPFPDTGGGLKYDEIMRANNICDYVNNKGVREVWLLKGAHQNAFTHSESKMAGPFGNISNGSLGGTSDMPVCNHTYRVYTHVYTFRDLFSEVWSHQIEAEMEHINAGLFHLSNAPCSGSAEYGCAPADPTRVMSKNTGLVDDFTGEYYTTIDPPPPGTSTPYTRADAQIYFDWGAGSPWPSDLSYPADNFSVRWIGTFVPTKTEMYSFYVTADDGAKLWLNGESLLGPDYSRGFLQERPLVAGTPYPIQMDYFERQEGAVVRLLWSSETTPQLPEKNVPGRCGNAHTAPNGRYNYDRSNPKPHDSDCMDWNPDGLGPLSPIRCYTADQPLNPALNEGGWDCGKPGTDPNHIFDNYVLNYTTWHWQNMPGRNNAKTYGLNKQHLRNWWDVHGDFDGVKTCNTTLLDSSACTADLGITSFRADPNPVNAGSATMAYYVSAINNGPETVHDGRVKITLPSGSTYVPYVPGSSSSPNCYGVGLTVTCYLGKLAQGGTRDFVLNVTLPFVSSLTATATTVLPGTFADTIPANNTAAVVFPPPTVTTFSPTFFNPVGTSDTLVIVNGTNFVPGLKQTKVSLNGADAPIMQVVSADMLFFVVPSGATTGKVSVTTPFGSATSLANFTVCSAITQVSSLGSGTDVTNEEVKVTFTGQIANAATFTTNPTTSTLYVCPNTTVNYTASATKGNLSCTLNQILVPTTGIMRINNKLVCSNRSGGGQDVDTFYVRQQP